MLEARAQSNRHFANPPPESQRPKEMRISYGQSWFATFASPNGRTAAASASPASWALTQTSFPAIANTTDPAIGADAVNDEVPSPEQSGGGDMNESKGSGKSAPPPAPEPKASVTNPEKVFWPQ